LSWVTRAFCWLLGIQSWENHLIVSITLISDDSNMFLED
jgi:hypothetical protein